jgi:putative DNA primase/helicase
VTAPLDAALDLLAHGYSVIPIRTDGTKAPALPTWKHHTQFRADEQQLHAWFGGDQPYDLGVVQGAVSGGAELTEIEGRAASRLPELRDLAHDTGLGDVWDVVTRGWVEMSPSGGFHFHYRVTGMDVPGNLKLARGADKLVLAETRGEGGQVVVAPSRHHPSGKAWQRLIGGPATAPVITAEQRDAFHALLRTLDEQPELVAPAAAPSAPHDPTAGITPGDDYENRTDWADILTPHGWTLATTRGRTRYWTRPGKTHGFSATTGHADDRDRLFVFTSSTDFAQEVPYTKLGAYAVLEHGGDMSAAARQLYADGFGQRAEEARPANASGDDLAGLIAPTNGQTSWTGPAPSAADASASTPSTPTTATAAPGGATSTASTTATSPARSDGPATYSETDDGNALRLVDTHAGTIRYVPQRGSWLTWNGHRWTWDEAGHVHELARGIARGLRADDRESRKHRSVSLSRRGLDAMVALARTDPRTVTHLAALDAQPFELNTPAGVVNLRTGAITAPDPAALHTRSTVASPDFDAPEPVRWNQFLADTFAGDPALTTYVQRLLGLSLVGQVLEQVLPFAHGLGANGKTTLLGVVQRLIGIGDDGYSISAPAEMLLATAQQGHPTEIARLAGARVVVSSELEDGQRFAEARVKQLTGRDVISGRFMRQDWFSFTPTHTLWMLANHQPAVRAGGPAFWRRLRLLPFEHTVPPEKRVPDLEDRLVEDEGPAILAWLIRGAADYFTDGLAEPASVRAATAAYERDTDTVGRFVDELCVTGDPNAQHLQVKASDLRQAYETWCRVEGEEAVTSKAFATSLRTRFGVLPGRTNTTRFYAGIRLADVSPDEPATRHEEPRWTQDGAL